jgi:hypothetical protein
MASLGDAGAAAMADVTSSIPAAVEAATLAGMTPATNTTAAANQGTMTTGQERTT